MANRVKIPGTRYYIELAIVEHEWQVQLVMDNSVESKVSLDDLTKNNIKQGVIDLFNNIQVQVNEIQRRQIIEELLNKTQHIFKKREMEVSTSSSTTSSSAASTSSLSKQSPSQTSTTTTSSTNREAGSASEFQDRLMREYKSKLERFKEEKQSKETIEKIEKEPENEDQIEEIIKSHKQINSTLESLDERVTHLEEVTMKLIKMTDMLLDKHSTMNK